MNMLNLKRVMRMTLLAAMANYSLLGQTAYAEDYQPVKFLVDKYSQASDGNKRKEVFKKLSQIEPKTQEDADNWKGRAWTLHRRDGTSHRRLYIEHSKSA
jgi:hypothetical protein